jgi:addiction module RelE/StbE family toxin
MTIITLKRFEKKSRLAPRSVQEALTERLLLFLNEPFHPILNNHRLKGELRAYRSINITGDWRAIYELLDENTFRFVDIDTHHNLYGT